MPLCGPTCISHLQLEVPPLIGGDTSNQRSHLLEVFFVPSGVITILDYVKNNNPMIDKKDKYKIDYFTTGLEKNAYDGKVRITREVHDYWRNIFIWVKEGPKPYQALPRCMAYVLCMCYKNHSMTNLTSKITNYDTFGCGRDVRVVQQLCVDSHAWWVPAKTMP